MALLEIPKGPAEGIYKEDLNRCGYLIESFLCSDPHRHGEIPETDQNIYQNEGVYIAPSAGDYLTEEFPNLKGIGMDFLAIGSASSKCPEGELPPDCHRHLLGYYTGSLSPVWKICIYRRFRREQRSQDFSMRRFASKGLDSSQVVCIAEIEE